MEIRPLTEAEQKYTYTQSMQLQGQTGCIGHLRGDFDKGGNGFFTSWDDHRKQWKTDEFKSELDDVINALRSSEYGLLENRSAMSKYAAQYPESTFQGNYCTEYGFRAETEKHAFLIRCNPTPGDYNFYCYCYVKEWLDQHIRNAEKGIRFINSRYKELFRIADGEKVTITDAMGEKTERTCRYIDECHMEVGSNLYHICQFAELMERNGSVYEPVEKTAKESEEKECVQEEKAAGTLELNTQFGTTEQVQLTVNTYMNNKSLYVGLTTVEDGFPEPYGDVTVNLMDSVPSYCAFVDTNNMPEVEDFLVKNGIAEFSTFQQKSGFCSYPLYVFDAERLRELCPDGMAAYEQANGLDRKAQKAEKSR